ncbi:hypothetical protein QE109_10960 [Fusibacter bizertensis]|uniref:Uncharacterized protein n=1 Tax=Fusibacter bizertensis TaxID=1488331 RepID=A0ABT6NE50_9FIRM|nr:hypothetical protein [Fusibacter bizertensis]MDH8678671.1 hypothetical protein [Fusibacter bizertensis]
MTTKQYLRGYFLLIIIIIVIGIFFFPISDSKLKSERESLMKIKLNQSISVLDEINTEGSVLFLVTTGNDETFVIQAEKFLGLNRYRLLHPISVDRAGETFELRSFLSDLTITVKDANLEVKARLNILKNAGGYIIILIVIPIVGILQSAIIARKSKKTNR